MKEFEFYGIEVQYEAEKSGLDFIEAAAYMALDEFGFFSEQYMHKHENNPQVVFRFASEIVEEEEELNYYIDKYGDHRNGWILTKEWLESLPKNHELVFYPEENRWDYLTSYANICKVLGISVKILIC